MCPDPGPHQAVGIGQSQQPLDSLGYPGTLRLTSGPFVRSRPSISQHDFRPPRIHRSGTIVQSTKDTRDRKFQTKFSGTHWSGTHRPITGWTVWWQRTKDDHTPALHDYLYQRRPYTCSTWLSIPKTTLHLLYKTIYTKDDHTPSLHDYLYQRRPYTCSARISIPKTTIHQLQMTIFTKDDPTPDLHDYLCLLSRQAQHGLISSSAHLRF
jgi:hypothetical protein